MKMKKYLWIPDQVRNDRGFTLLELLVVIGIIGILMTLATVAYSSAQSGGRNSRRKQDLVAIQNALEQYYSANAFKYPTGTCSTGTSAYLKSSWPTDPSTGQEYVGTDDCSETTYCICAVMESAVSSGNSGANCAWNTDKTNYCVGNLQ